LITQFGKLFLPPKSMLESLNLVSMWTTFVNLTSVSSTIMPNGSIKKGIITSKWIIQIRTVIKQQSKLKRTRRIWLKRLRRLQRRSQCLNRSNHQKLCRLRRRWL
jgi:hypothetical protein